MIEFKGTRSPDHGEETRPKSWSKPRSKSWMMAAFLLWIAYPPPNASASDNPFDRLPAEFSQAVVTVHYLSQINMPGVNQEVDREVSCLMIESGGLVLCSSSEMGGYFRVMARLLGRSSGPISSRPRDLRISIPGMEEEWSGKLIARDSDRDLAWLVLEDVPEETTFKFVDFSRSIKPEVGSRAFVLRRLDKFFGSKATVTEFSVSALLERPRSLFLASRPLGFLGMPAFDRDGAAIGILVAQVPREGEGDPALQSRGLPGQAGPVDDMIGSLILPASEVLKATRLAKETWAADQTESLQ